LCKLNLSIKRNAVDKLKTSLSGRRAFGEHLHQVDKFPRPPGFLTALAGYSYQPQLPEAYFVSNGPAKAIA
jgi:hypothetical protein